MRNLKTLHNKIKNCQKCEKLCPWKKFKDADYGNLKSKLMLIGEAPGEIAIRNDLTWSGPAGKKLRKILSPIGKLEDIFYMTNVLKCLPPGNRDPQVQEIENCRQFLEKEIKLVNPRVIFVIGRFSMNLVFDIFKIEQKPITQLHGKEIIARDITVIPLYHPSYCNIWTKTYDKDVYNLVSKYHKLAAANIFS